MYILGIVTIFTFEEDCLNIVPFSKTCESLNFPVLIGCFILRPELKSKDTRKQMFF